MFGFVAKHRGIWPVAFLCEALGVSRSGFYAWLTRRPSARSRREEVLEAKIKSSFQDSDRTYSARRVWHDLLAAGIKCGLHAIERLMRRNGLRARPRRRRLPIDLGDRSAAAISANANPARTRELAVEACPSDLPGGTKRRTRVSGYRRPCAGSEPGARAPRARSNAGPALADPPSRMNPPHA